MVFVVVPKTVSSSPPGGKSKLGGQAEEAMQFHNWETEAQV